MVRTKKYDKKSSKKKRSEFSMADRKGFVIIGKNIPSAEKKCVKEKSKEVAEKRVLDSNYGKDSKPQSNHKITSSLFQVIEIPGKNLGCVAAQDMPKGKEGCIRGHGLSAAVKLGTPEPKFLQSGCKLTCIQ